MKYLIERINFNDDYSVIFSFETDDLISVYYSLLNDFYVSKEDIDFLIANIKKLSSGSFLIYKDTRITKQLYNFYDDF